MKKFYFLLVAMLVSLAANAAGYYINGNFISWKGWTETALKDYQLTETTTGVYSLDLSKTQTPDLSGAFVITYINGTSPDWGKKIGTNGSNVVAGQEYKYKVGGNDLTAEGTIKNAVITLDTNNGTLFVEGAAQGNSFTTVYMIGDFGSGWSTDQTTYPLTAVQGAANTYKGTITCTTTVYTKPKAGTQILGPSGEDLKPVSGETYTLSASGDKSLAIAAGTYEIEVVVDQKADNCTIKVTKEGGDTPVDPVDPTPGNYEGWYLNVQGDFNSWQPEGVAFNAEGFAEAKNLAIGTSEFELKIWDGKADKYLANGAEPIEPGKSYIVGEGFGAHMTIAGASEGDVYNVSYDYPTQTMVVTKVSSGVEVVEAENAAAEYFNLQGVKVAEPTSGLYIVKRGNKVTKEIVK